MTQDKAWLEMLRVAAEQGAGLCASDVRYVVAEIERLRETAPLPSTHGESDL